MGFRDGLSNIKGVDDFFGDTSIKPTSFGTGGATGGVSDVTVDEPDVDKTKIGKQLGAGAIALKAGLEILNANSKMRQIQEKAKHNIMLANFQAAEIEAIGKEQALKAETKGIKRGEQSLLAAAAQGQEVQGGIAQSSQRGEETIGLINAMAIESNAIRKAFGYRSQASLLQLESDLAEVQRDREVVGSLLDIGFKGAMLL